MKLILNMFWDHFFPGLLWKKFKRWINELIKEFEISEKVYVKVAVRISKKGKLFARTLYKLTDTERFEYQLSKRFL